MSNPNPNSSASLTTSPSLSTAPEIPVNSVTAPPCQPPPAPPPPPLQTIRPQAPLGHPNQLQQFYVQSIPNQDLSPVLYQFSPQARGFPVRPVRGFVADPSLMARNQSGYVLHPGLAYNHQQVGPNQMQMQFMRGRNPQIHQSPRLVSGPVRGIPLFLQPRVGSPRTPILETSKNRKARNKDDDLVLVRGRKVRITEGASLYSLCRSWLKNGDHVGIQLQRSGTFKPLPKPLPVVKTETSVADDSDEDKEDEEAVKELSEKDLLKRHIKRAKKVRARFREERWRKIKRFTERLALLLPPASEREVHTPEEDILIE